MNPLYERKPISNISMELNKMHKSMRISFQPIFVLKIVKTVKKNTDIQTYFWMKIKNQKKKIQSFYKLFDGFK